MSSETGHAKNIANFKTLTVFIESLGDVYKPTKTASQLESLKSMLAEAEKRLKKLTDSMPAYKMAVDEQEAAFEKLDKLVVRAANAFEASVDSPAEADSAVSLKRTITGVKKRRSDDNDEKLPGETNDEAAEDKPKSRSVSQQSYDSLVENFSAFIDLLAANAKYAPNEEDLKAESLLAFRDELKQKTEAVDKVEALVINARIERNKLLYPENTGLVDTAKGVKKYMSSLFGPSSPQMNYVNDLAFSNYKK